MPADGLNRRRFVVGGAALGLLAAGAVPGDGGRPRVLEPSPPFDPVVDSLVVLGTAYRAAHPEEADIITLRALVPQLAEASTRQGLAARLGRLEVVAAAQVDRGEFATVLGWVLAPVEARAAALCAVLPDR